MHAWNVEKFGASHGWRNIISSDSVVNRELMVKMMNALAKWVWSKIGVKMGGSRVLE